MIENVKENINNLITFVNENYQLFLKILLPLIILFEIVKICFADYLDSTYLQYNYRSFLIYIFKLLFINLQFIITVKILDMIKNKQEVNYNEIYSYVRSKYINVLIGTIVIGIIINLGFFLLIIPGIFLSVRLCTSLYFITFNNTKLLKAISLSYFGTAKIAWIIFWTGFIISIPLVILHFTQDFITSQFTMSIVSIMIYLYYSLETILFYSFYLDVKNNLIKGEINT